MPTTRRSFSKSNLVVLTGLTACKQVKDLGGTFADLAKLQAQLVQKLGHAGIQLAIVNGNLLRIQVVNSPFSNLPAKEKQLKSLEIAKIAYEVLESRSRLSNILVAFSTKRSYLFVIHTETVDSAINFPVSALAPKPARANQKEKVGLAVL
jgi:hypothetical protein